MAAEPAKANARFELISLLIVDGQFDAAAPQVKEAREARGGDLRLLYFEALIAFGRRTTPGARTDAAVAQAGARACADAGAGGRCRTAGKAVRPGRNYLQKAVWLAPQHNGARTLLVRSYWHRISRRAPWRRCSRCWPQALRIDPATMMLAGETYLANGDLKQASQYFEAASQSKQQESVARIRLGQIAMASGDVERGIRQLEAATAPRARRCRPIWR